MNNDSDDELEAAYKKKSDFLRSMASKSRNTREDFSRSETDPDNSFHYGQESEHRKASIPTRDVNLLSGEVTKYNNTDAEDLNDEADASDNEFKRQMRLKFLNKLKLSK